MLLPAGVLALLSSIQMEACGGTGLWGIPFPTWMYLHCILGLLMILLAVEHLYLHFGKKRWLMKLRRLGGLSRWLCMVLALLAALSVIALGHTVVSMNHSPIGAVHGKVGFLFLALCLWHTVRHWGWISRQMFRS